MHSDVAYIIELRLLCIASNTAGDNEVHNDTFSDGLAGVIKTVKSLGTNGPYVFALLYHMIDFILLSGLQDFGAKYFQQQFGLTSSIAGTSLGMSLYNYMTSCIIVDDSVLTIHLGAVFMVDWRPYNVIMQTALRRPIFMKKCPVDQNPASATLWL